ncbi:MAG: hypothetical protein ACFFB5_13855 [Promethearchaeota archaeon]
MDDPPYTIFVESLKEATRKKFVETLLNQGLTDFKSLYIDYLKISETNARHHLNILLESNIVVKEKQPGTKAIYLRISPRFIERARRYFENTQKYAYLGMVGKKNSGLQLNQSIERLKSHGWAFKALFIFTTTEIIEILENDDNWLNLQRIHSEAQLIEVPLLEFEPTYQTMKQVIDDIILNYSIITDITGLTKIHTLSLYILAKEYGLRRFYLPEKKVDTVISLP